MHAVDKLSGKKPYACFTVFVLEDEFFSGFLGTSGVGLQLEKWTCG